MQILLFFDYLFNGVNFTRGFSSFLQNSSKHLKNINIFKTGTYTQKHKNMNINSIFIE